MRVVHEALCPRVEPVEATLGTDPEHAGRILQQREHRGIRETRSVRRLSEMLEATLEPVEVVEAAGEAADPQVPVVVFEDAGNHVARK